MVSNHISLFCFLFFFLNLGDANTMPTSLFGMVDDELDFGVKHFLSLCLGPQFENVLSERGE